MTAISISVYRLLELNEHIEVLDTAIEFKNKTIISTELRASEILESQDTQTETLSKMKHIPSAQARALLACYFDRVVEMRLEGERKKRGMLKMEAELEEKRNVIRSLQRSVKQSQLEAERKLLIQEKVREMQRESRKGV